MIYINVLIKYTRYNTIDINFLLTNNLFLRVNFDWL